MKDWLAKLAEQTKSEDEVLHEQLQNLSPEMLQELAYEFDPSTRPTQMDAMAEKIANAQRMGVELAHEHGDELEKQAFLPLVAGMLGRAAVGQGIKSLAGSVVKNVAKDAIVNGATKAVSSAVRPPASMGGGAMAAAPGGFNYGKVASLGEAAGVAVNFAKKNPALVAGAAATGLAARHLENRRAQSNAEIGARRAMGKTAAFLIDDAIGGLIGHRAGKHQKERGEQYHFGGKQLAGTLLLPGGAGYQVGRYFAHHPDPNKEKKAFDLKGLGRMAAGAAYRHPGAALTVAGAGVGALMAPRDPQTGEKQYLRGAMMGGGLAAGAHALSDGRLGNMAKKMVTRQNNPVFGQGARRYMIESAAATRPGAAAPAMAAAAPAAAHSAGPVMSSKAPEAAAPNMFEGWAPPSYRGGPTMGNVKVAAARALRNALLVKLAAGAPALFSTKLSPAKASGAVMGGGMKGLQSATRAATPPPTPMKRPAMGTGTFAAPAGPSPFAAAPARPAPAQAGGGLAGVQNQLNSARSIAGGGPMMPSGGSVVRAAPGSGW